jgi:hypothetical protein
MQTRSDFRIIRFNERLGDRRPPSNFNPGSSHYAGQETSEKRFEVDREPVGDGYLVIQVYGVDFRTHRVLVNGEDLPQFDIASQQPGRPVWETWLDPIEEGILRRGRNTIRIMHGSTPQPDNFIVGNVVVHWREEADGSGGDGYDRYRNRDDHGDY